MDQFASGSQSFLEWFTSQPGTVFHPSLNIADLRDRQAGRGIIATADIPAETDLFTIPRSAIISVETSELAQKLPELFKEPEAAQNNDEDIPSSDLPTSWLNLILILLYENLHHNTSRWSPYLSVLPSKSTDFNTLMFWTPPELGELQASAMLTKIGKNNADTMFREHIIPVVRKHAEVFFPSYTGISTDQSDEILIDSCHIIGSLIMSYAFDLQPDTDSDDESENEDGWIEDKSRPSTMGMVPMADMLNADAEFNAHLSHGDEALTMTSLREIKAGEEVLNYYGPLPNGELLRRYGYTSKKHSRYDVVEIDWNLVKNTVLESEAAAQWNEQIKKAMSKLEEDDVVDAQDGFILDREAGDPDEQGLCTSEALFTKFPDELVDIISDIAGQLLQFESQKRRAPIGDEKTLLKRTTLTILKDVVHKRLKQYPTSIAQDEELFRQAGVLGRFRMALEVRLGEKRLLQEALTWTRSMLEKYNESSTSSGRSVANGQPNRKKQKR